MKEHYIKQGLARGELKETIVIHAWVIHLLFFWIDYMKKLGETGKYWEGDSFVGLLIVGNMVLFEKIKLHTAKILWTL